MSLLRQLDEAFAKNSDPDAVALMISNPFRVMRTFGSITKIEYETFRETKINVYNPDGSFNSSGYAIKSFTLHESYWGSLKKYNFIAVEYDPRET